MAVDSNPRPVGKLWKVEVPLPADPGRRSAFFLINAQRQRIDSPPLEWDEEIAAGCRLHARYCQLNNCGGHEERPGFPGYSEAGERSGKESIVGRTHADCARALGEQLRTAFHCASAVSPDLVKTGFAAEGNTFVMNIARGLKKAHRAYQAHYRGEVSFFWPPHGARDVLTAFNPTGEVPMPLPGRERDWKARIGQAVFARVGGRGAFEIVLRDPAGTPVEGTHTSPPEGISIDFSPDNHGLVCLAPDGPLRPKTRYRAEVYEGEGARRLVIAWSFRTR
jgi:hypothetical protein